MSTGTPSTTEPRRRSLWHHRDFRLLWFGDTVSVVGFQLVSLAIPVMALRMLDADAFEMGLLTSLELAAFLLIGLPAGAWVDRWRKKRVIVLGDVLRGALLLTLPAAYALDVLTLVQMYVVAFAVGCLTVFFDVANQSYLPELLDTPDGPGADAISEGNSKLSATQQVAGVAGPSVAAGLIRLMGPAATIAVTAVCMAASSFSVSRIRTTSPPPERKPGSSLRSEIAEGLGFVVRHPLLVRITACTGLSNFASSLSQALFVLYVLRTLDLSTTTLGLALSAGAVGGLLGAVLADRLARLVGEGRSIPLMAAVAALSTFHLPLASLGAAVPLLVVGGFLMSFSAVAYNVVQVSFRQRVCPKPLLGRMNASIRFLVWGPMPVGAFLGGVLGSTLGVLPTLWLGVALSFLALLPVLLSPLATMRDLPRDLAVS